MLFRERMFLANCDTVRQLPAAEIEKRFLLGVTFAQGVIVTPSLLLDNQGFSEVLKRPNLYHWYREEGLGTLTVRSPSQHHFMTMEDYFDGLPGGYRLARCGGKPKQELTSDEVKQVLVDLRSLDKNLVDFVPTRQALALKSDALTKAIIASPTFAAWKQSPSAFSDQFDQLLDQADGLNSRSAWYQAAEQNFGEDTARFKTEVIDSAYHGLFVGSGEAFAADRIPVLERIPARILDAGLFIRSLRKEKEMIDYAIKGFDLITAFGGGEIAKFLLDEAISYVEDKVEDTSMAWFSRRNWFGLYPKLTSSMGVEIK
jgi:hypothetical protein